jgi:mannose-6-phosphate isomerase-like protein (cupin superfamily)
MMRSHAAKVMVRNPDGKVERVDLYAGDSVEIPVTVSLDFWGTRIERTTFITVETDKR